MLHLYAALAEKERSLIAARTCEALRAAKARGVVLGNPRLSEVRQRGTQVVKADAMRFALNIKPLIDEIRRSGVTSLRGIAKMLDRRAVPTARGGTWTAVQVKDIIRRTDAADVTHPRITIWGGIG